jgi:homocysteine S-methyltransferase
MKSITTRLEDAPIVLLDGAMGTELLRRGVKTPLPSWSARALIENPEIVREIHEDYIGAGAEVITTNTFRTTARALGKVGLAARAKELTQLAVQLAKEARKENSVWIAGSVAPLEDCYEPELAPDSEIAFHEHKEFIGWLVEAGVDFILIETMSTIQESIAAARAAEPYGLPIFVSWTCGSDGNILSGESIQEGIRMLEPYHPSAFLVNCTPAKVIETAIRKTYEVSRVPVGAYANIGKPEPVNGWEFTHDLDPVAYAMEAKRWIQADAKIVGGCCGTTPNHISELRNAIR